MVWNMNWVFIYQATLYNTIHIIMYSYVVVQFFRINKITSLEFRGDLLHKGRRFHYKTKVQLFKWTEWRSREGGDRQQARISLTRWLCNHRLVLLLPPLSSMHRPSVICSCFLSWIVFVLVNKHLSWTTTVQVA